MKIKRRLIPCLFLLLGAPAWSQTAPAPATTTPAASSPVATPVDVTIQIGTEVLDKEPPAMLVDGRVLIPLRKVFNALGATVRYENKIITANRGQRTVVLSPNVTKATLDGQEVELAVPPLLFDGATYVPLRFVAQALGDEVAYDAATKMITVSAPQPQGNVVAEERVNWLKPRLKQLVVGNQGAILKVWDQEQTKEVYYRGLDDRDTAPYDGDDHLSILNAVEMNGGVAEWASDVMDAFKLLPKREAVAFLGLVYSIPDESPHDPGDSIDDRVREFLIQVAQESTDVVLRRQAVLSMAVGESLDPDVLEAVLKLYESSENLWETFPVQQYFQYHAQRIKTLPNFATIRERVASVNSLYTANILNYLDN